MVNVLGGYRRSYGLWLEEAIDIIDRFKRCEFGERGWKGGIEVKYVDASVFKDAKFWSDGHRWDFVERVESWASCCTC